MNKTANQTANCVFLFLGLVGSGVIMQSGLAQTQCDPSKVVTVESCAKCHEHEVKVWKSTPHFRSFEELGRRPKAKEICNNLGLRSAKRSDVCIDCHYTTQEIGGRAKPVSGVSCESCHGSAKDWVTIHNDYGGPTASKENETDDHRQQRFVLSVENGMKNTRNLYLIARSYYGCHTVPNEKLVNVGGHHAGSLDFELVAWSQGQVRHNFLRTGGLENGVSEIERLRVMYVVGLIADLEFSTRATAKATSKSAYGVNVANRSARASVKLFELQQKINDPNIQHALQAFAGAELKINNTVQLDQIADEIQAAGKRFAESAEGSKLGRVDEGKLPNQAASSNPAVEIIRGAVPVVAKGGWFRDDSIFQVSYRPGGHADQCIQSWTDLIASLPDANVRVETSELFKQLTNVNGIGLCRSCHTVDQLDDDSFQVNWIPEYRDITRRGFTRFAHGPHLIQPLLQNCTHCHELNESLSNSQSFVDFDSSNATSNLKPVTKSNCSNCHHKDRTNNGCTQCHNYHVGSQVIGN